MFEFTVFIKDKSNAPVGWIDVYLFDHENLKYEDGRPVYEWKIKGFPINFKWIKQFGNLENELNRYVCKEHINKGHYPDVIIKPVSKSTAIEITLKFVELLRSNYELWSELAIKWPYNCFTKDSNRTLYMKLLAQECKNLCTTFFNHKHYDAYQSPFTTIAWDIIIRNLLFENHNDYFELFVKSEQITTERLIDNNDISKFISYKDIIQEINLYESNLNKKNKNYNLSENLIKLMSTYEVDKMRFFKNVNLNISSQREVARYFYIPIDEERVNSGIYMMLDGYETRHIYINLEDDAIDDFRETIRGFTGARADDNDDEIL